MSKRKTVSQLKKKLWKPFSLWTKLRYSEDGVYVDCYTCSQRLKIGTSNCQAAHFLPKGGYPAHYFNIDNVRPGCYRCNIHLSGNSEVFRRRLIEEIGLPRVEALWATRKEVKQLRQDWYYRMLDFYTADIKRLEDSF